MRSEEPLFFFSPSSSFFLWIVFFDAARVVNGGCVKHWNEDENQPYTGPLTPPPLMNGQLGGALRPIQGGFLASNFSRLR